MAVALVAADEVTTDRSEAHTFIGLGLIATVVLILWLLRRSRV